MSTKMTSTERRAVFGLSTIIALRMVGLFMVLPLFTLYATQLSGATPFLIGLAMGVYGLCQAVLQIPFGALSDRYGRKPIIIFGLLIFIVGSVISGLTHSIFLMIIGRALQGVGAVGSTLLALMADLTREDQRTKAMAIAGITIGFAFSLAMLIGPLLTKWVPFNNLFILAAGFGILAILLLCFTIPTPTTLTWHGDTEPELQSVIKLLFVPELAKLNAGIFFLHAIFTASFIVIPISLYHFEGLIANRQWILYLPTLFGSFVICLILVGLSEKKKLIKPFFLIGIVGLIIAEMLFWFNPTSFNVATIALTLFFAGFSLLEAFLPSLVSRLAPAARKGSALGIYSCAQFFGIFIGGVLGGWLYGKYSFAGVYLLCISLAFFWLIIAFYMQPPRFLTTQMWRLSPSQQLTWQALVSKLKLIPGMVEVTFIAEDGIAYLKMEQGTIKHPDFIHYKEQLQSE